MRPHLKDLSDIIASTPRPPTTRDPLHEDRFLIDHLVEMVEDMGLGDVTYKELRREFRRHNIPNFDLDLWMSEMVEKGIYFEPPSEE